MTEAKDIAINWTVNGAVVGAVTVIDMEVYLKLLLLVCSITFTIIQIIMALKKWRKER